MLRSDEFKKPLLHKRADAEYTAAVLRDESAFQGYRVERIEKVRFPIVFDKDELIFDFGNHYTGYLHIELENGTDLHIADSPTNIAFEFAEMPIELMEEPDRSRRALSFGWAQKDYKTIPFMPYQGSLERRYAFRYLRIKRTDAVNFPVKITALYIDSVSAVDLNSALPCNAADLLLKRIDAMCLNSLKECEQEIFEDGPKRDRRLWIGDLRLQALVDYVSFGNIDLIKRCIYLFAEHLNEKGVVAPCVFPDTPPFVDQFIYMDYALCFILCLYDYYVNTGDKELIAELYDTAEYQVKYAEKHFDRENGKIDIPVFIDHGRLDKTVAALGFFIYALKRMTVIADALDCDTKWLSDLIEDSEKAIMKYYSEDKGLFVAPDGEISYHSQVWAALSEVLDKNKNAELLSRIADCGSAVKISTPFMQHYYLEALYGCGMTDEAEGLIKSFWGAMLNAGFDCCPECFVPGDDRFSPYCNPTLNSACHAWSCSAAYWIRKYGN